MGIVSHQMDAHAFATWPGPRLFTSDHRVSSSQLQDATSGCETVQTTLRKKHKSRENYTLPIRNDESQMFSVKHVEALFSVGIEREGHG